MGILNLTPDSFSDGGRFVSIETACAHARAMNAEGADLIDIGGESTRPSAQPVSEQEELDRVIPVIERLRSELDIPLSVDTMKPAVMRAAQAAGADLINDVHALQAPGALAAAASSNAAVCLMHMRGEPRTMQEAPIYADVVAEVCAFLQRRVQACVEAGIAADRILLDPGFGFGKRLTHNLQLLANLHAVVDLDFPVLVGLSRKSMLGQLCNAPVSERLAAGLAAATAAVLGGAAIIRTHDVRPTRDAVRVAAAVRLAKGRYI
ncbi:dihydropteroate synthase [Panacagrimonas sp.]|uniref:dihydropteroate synthase n=1 Tax=Panacagrimonas sp. TaxID=2480088 RepID=UPI003B518058